MISSLNGIIKSCKEQQVVISIGPVCFEVHVANSSYFTPNEATELFTHLQWNQEQGPALYGFQNETEKQVFQLLISCPGLGPKIGLAVIDQLGAATFLQIIQTGNENALSKVTGIGIKKAEQIIVQLRHKVKKLLDSGIELDNSEAQTSQQWSNVINALESLGYSREEINKVMKHLSEERNIQSLTFEQLMRKALAFLSK